MHNDGPVFDGNEKVSKVIDQYPFLDEVFLEYGFKNILNPIMRRTVATKVTLKMACSMKGVDFDTFITALAERIRVDNGDSNE